MKKKKRLLDLAEVSLYTIPEDELLDVPEEDLVEMADWILEDFDIDLTAGPGCTDQELDEKYLQFVQKLKAEGLYKA